MGGRISSAVSRPFRYRSSREPGSPVPRVGRDATVGWARLAWREPGRARYHGRMRSPIRGFLTDRAVTSALGWQGGDRLTLTADAGVAAGAAVHAALDIDPVRTSDTEPATRPR
jgi:hypothetical protein